MNMEQARRVLEGHLPPVTLLLGASAEHLSSLAYQVARERGLVGPDFLEVMELTADQSRNTSWFAQLHPSPGTPFRLILIRLDGASEQGQNILLKVLEETPDLTRFILVATSPPLPTIMSRSQVMRIGAGLAQPEESEEARRARPLVAAALKAAASGDPGVLQAAMRGWEPIHTIVLGSWAAEAAAGRWQLFDEGYAGPGATMEHARRVLVLLNAYHGARNSGAVALHTAFGRG